MAGTGGPEGGGACLCGRCPHGARAGHRQAVAAFVALREEFAAGRGVPAGLAHSAGAARQWVSDELTLSARTLAERAAAEGVAWLAAVQPPPPAGGLWHDRRQRPTHFLPRTRPRPGEVARMWSWVAEQAGVTP